jgi:DnaK suppressor protein
MKETVSKTAKKTSSTAAPATGKTAAAKARPATTAKAKPASRPAAKAAASSRAAAPAPKAVAVKAVKAVRAASATKAAPAKASTAGAKSASIKVAKAPAKPAGVKAVPARAAAGSAKSVALKAAPAKAAEKAPRSTKQKAEAVSPAAKAGSAAPASRGAQMAEASRGMVELADKMETPVVSKVSEVMTKTTKPNTAAQAEERILTEDEIRAMSDEDYMNPAQLAFFKAKLQALEKELLKNAGETTEHLRETVLVPDPADRATIEEEHALELRTRDRERKLLKKVQQSLASIESGEYGWCEETGEPIGIPRLIARPTATLSLEAQQRRELKQKLYGD